MQNLQENRLAYIALGLLVLVLFVLGVLLYPRFTAPAAPVNTVTTMIPVVHQYKNGTHTYIGSVGVPTPCHTISGQAVVRESYPEQVDIRLETKEGSGVCAQVITNKKFKVSFQASSEAVVREYLNSTPVLFQVSEAPASVNLQTTTI